MKAQFTAKPGTRMLVLGNEAIARGAIEGGVQVVAAYPGTPSSEIPETLIDLKDAFGYYAEWSANEKVAFDVAAGASLVGSRALATMKGAGLNWAMDTFMTLPITGVRGGYVVVVADDPGAHYSSNEQDSRLAAQWAGIPCLEPEHQMDAKEMTKAAFFLSEAVELPVLVRSVTRLSHASGVVEFGEIEANKATIGFNKHYKIPFRWNVYGPPDLVTKHEWQLTQLKKAADWAENSSFNEMKLVGCRIGIVAAGIAAGYAREALQELGLEDNVNFWKVGVVYPLAEKQAQQFLAACDRLLVVEEGGPMLENLLRALAQESGMKLEIQGKQYSRPFSQAGELSTDLVYAAVAAFAGVPLTADATLAEAKAQVKPLVIPRSSTLCAGCPHLGTYWAIVQACPPGARVVPIINGDIGCYEQAGYGVQGQMPKPNEQSSQRYRPMSLYTVLDTLYVMGSGLSMAQGEVCAGYKDGPIVAVAGDSTFFHATMPALLNAVWNKTRLTFVIMDNSITAMTGHQPSPVTQEEHTQQLSIESVVRGIGVPFVRTVDSYNIEDVTEAVREALAFDGVSVVISRRACALQVFRNSGDIGTVYVETELCNGCKQCIVLGCPAVVYKDGKASINQIMCVNCGICIQVCPQGAIKEGGK